MHRPEPIFPLKEPISPTGYVATDALYVALKTDDKDEVMARLDSPDIMGIHDLIELINACVLVAWVATKKIQRIREQQKAFVESGEINL